VALNLTGCLRRGDAGLRSIPTAMPTSGDLSPVHFSRNFIACGLRTTMPAFPAHRAPKSRHCGAVGELEALGGLWDNDTRSCNRWFPIARGGPEVPAN